MSNQAALDAKKEELYKNMNELRHVIKDYYYLIIRDYPNYNKEQYDTIHALKSEIINAIEEDAPLLQPNNNFVSLSPRPAKRGRPGQRKTRKANRN